MHIFGNKQVNMGHQKGRVRHQETGRLTPLHRLGVVVVDSAGQVRGRGELHVGDLDRDLGLVLTNTWQCGFHRRGLCHSWLQVTHTKLVSKAGKQT